MQPALNAGVRRKSSRRNADAKPEDRFKVWPTNRDRPAFNAIMSAMPPVNHDAVAHSGERMVEAHRFFSQQAREWLSLEGPGQVQARAAAVEASPSSSRNWPERPMPRQRAYG